MTLPGAALPNTFVFLWCFLFYYLSVGGFKVSSTKTIFFFVPSFPAKSVNVDACFSWVKLEEWAWCNQYNLVCLHFLTILTSQGQIFFDLASITHIRGLLCCFLSLGKSEDVNACCFSVFPWRKDWMKIEQNWKVGTAFYPHRPGSHLQSIGHPTFSFLVAFNILDLEISKVRDHIVQSSCTMSCWICS